MIGQVRAAVAAEDADNRRVARHEQGTQAIESAGDGEPFGGIKALIAPAIDLPRGAIGSAAGLGEDAAMARDLIGRQGDIGMEAVIEDVDGNRVTGCWIKRPVAVAGGNHAQQHKDHQQSRETCQSPAQNKHDVPHLSRRRTSWFGQRVQSHYHGCVIAA